jgi:hypothetical protein
MDEANTWLINYNFQRSRSANDRPTFVWAEPVLILLEGALWAAYRATTAERPAKARSGYQKLLKGFAWTEGATRLAALADGIKPKGAV